MRRRGPIWAPGPRGRRPRSRPLEAPGGRPGARSQVLLEPVGDGVGAVEDVWAAPAPDEEAGLLGIEPGSPVLVMLRTAFGVDGLAFQVDPAMRVASARQRYELTAN